MELGRGFHGIVRMVRKKHTRREYACKSIRKNDKTPIHMIQSEIESMKGLHHKHIVELQVVFEEPHFVHIVCELCRGEDLLERIGSGDWNATEQESAKLIKNILSAIAYLHDNGVVHRGLKAANFVFLSKNTNTDIKIIDFGVARKLPPKEGESPTCDALENVLTTKVETPPSYVAPEILTQERYNCKCDVWSVGVVAYFVLSRGKLPYSGDSDKETASMLQDPNLQCEYEPAETWARLNDSAKAFCQALMQRDVASRPTAQEALELHWIVSMAGSLSPKYNKAHRRKQSKEDKLDSFLRTITLSKSSSNDDDL